MLRHRQDDGARRADRRVLRSGRDDRRARRHHVHREGRDRAGGARARGARGGARAGPDGARSATASTPACAACTARASRRSTRSRRACCTSARSSRRSIRSCACSTTVAASVLFSEVYDDVARRDAAGVARALERAVNRGFDTDATCAGWPRCCTTTARRCRRAGSVRRRRPDVAGLPRRGRARGDALRAELGACTNEDDAASSPRRSAIIDWVERLRRERGAITVEVERRRALPRRRRVAAGRRRKGATGRATPRCRGEARGRVRAARRDAFADALRGEVIAEIVPLVEEFVARYAARRRADGVADFDDLLCGRATCCATTARCACTSSGATAAS